MDIRPKWLNHDILRGMWSSHVAMETHLALTKINQLDNQKLWHHANKSL